MRAKQFVKLSIKEWSALCISMAMTVTFYLFYIGYDITYYNDSPDYLWISSYISWDYFFSDAYSGFHPPLYFFFIKAYSSFMDKPPLEISAAINLLIAAFFGGSLYAYVRSLGFSMYSGLWVCLCLLSNSFLYCHGIAGLNAEVLYFPLMLLMLAYYYSRDFNVGKIFYVVFGSLVLIRNIHLFLFPLVFVKSSGWRNKAVNSLAFLSMSLLMHIKTAYFSRTVRELKENLRFALDWSSEFHAVKNVFGFNGVPSYTANILIVLLVFTVIIIFLKKNQETKGLKWSALWVGGGFLCLIFMTHFLFDEQVSLKERLIFHAHLVVFPIIMFLWSDFLNRWKRRTAIFSCTCLIFLGLNISNYFEEKIFIDSIKLENIWSRVPSFISEYKPGSFVASNIQGLLRYKYGLDGFENFFRPDKLGVNYANAKRVTQPPDTVEVILIYLYQYDKILDVKSFLSSLDKCDIRSQYEYQVIVKDVDYERGVMHRKHLLARECYE